MQIVSINTDSSLFRRIFNLEEDIIQECSIKDPNKKIERVYLCKELFEQFVKENNLAKDRNEFILGGRIFCNYPFISKKDMEMTVQIGAAKNYCSSRLSKEPIVYPSTNFPKLDLFDLNKLINTLLF